MRRRIFSIWQAYAVFARLRRFSPWRFVGFWRTKALQALQENPLPAGKTEWQNAPSGLR